MSSDVFERARAGNVLAFTALVKEHQSMVYSLALRMLGSREESLDLAQEVFMQLHAKMHMLESADHLRAWLRRVATHRSVDQLRQRPTHVPLDRVAEPQADECYADHWLQGRLGELLLTLAPDARAVMLLRYQEDLGPDAIAATLEMSVNTVKSHLKRSLEALRRHAGAFR